MVDKATYEAYQAKNAASIKAMLEGMGCRPVLFMGSGVSRRYINGPSWHELLKVVADTISLPADDFSYFSQRSDNNPIQLGTFLADEVHKWGWTSGKNHFPKEYYGAGTDRSLFIKYLVSEHLTALTAEAAKNNPLGEEIELLKRISPHAVITTNFDDFLEGIFPDYEVISGERIIPLSMNIIGELYKIHGTVSEPASMVLTSADYDRYRKKRRYITSKLMTYFAEYPIFIFGYGLGDTNINEIITDLAEALEDKGGLLENVIYVEWVPDIAKLASLREEYALPAEDPKQSIRLRTIVTDDLKWVLEVLADLSSPVPVNTRVLRELAARVVELVRTDVPANQIEVNYQHIESLLDNASELASILGISNIKNPNIAFPYLSSQVGEKLGFKGWHAVHKLMPKANQRVGFDIKASDNDYHMGFKSGRKSITHKFSEAFVSLLKSIIDEEDLGAGKLNEDEVQILPEV